MLKLETGTRPNLEKDQLLNLSRFLETCDYLCLPLGKNHPGQIKFVRNLTLPDNFPRFDLTITLADGQTGTTKVNLHKDRSTHRVDKKAGEEIAKEGRRILGQLSTFKILSPPESIVFKNALLDFLLFGAGESMQKQRQIEGKSYSRRLLNKRYQQPQRRRQGWRKKQKLEKTSQVDWEF